MNHDRNQTIDWDVVFRACRLEDVGLTYELFIKDPWNVLHGLDRLDAIETLEAGELPVPVDPATPAFWDALYQHCELATRGVSRQRFKCMPWLYLMGCGYLDAPRRVTGRRSRRGARPTSVSAPAAGDAASASSHSTESADQLPGKALYRPSNAPPRAGVVRRIIDSLAQVVDSFYPLVLTAEGRWRIDRERIAAGGDRYSMRVYFLVLIASLAGFVADALSESLMLPLAILAFTGMAVVTLMRLGSIEVSVQD